jgi:integrase
MPADPSLVALYLEEHANARTTDGGYAFSPTTLSRWVASLNQVCRAGGASAPGQHPGVKAALSAIRRTRAQPSKRREPLLLADLATVVDTIRRSAGRLRAGRIVACRDVAVLTAGFFGGFRRSELSALRLTDIGYDTADGLHVRIRQSKTDQEARGQVKALPFTDTPQLCPVCAMLGWIQLVKAWDRHGRAGLMRVLRAPDFDPEEGHVCSRNHPALADGQLAVRHNTGSVFRGVHRAGTLQDGLSGHAINNLIQDRAQQTGIDAGRVANMGGHSLRAGLVTEAYRAGASAEEIARQTGHESLSVLAGYRREHAPLAGNAVTRLTGQPTAGSPKRAAGETGTGDSDGAEVVDAGADDAGDADEHTSGRGDRG